MDLFNFDLPNFKFTKSVRLIELFAGYGSQALACKYLGLDFEHYRICEFDKYAVQSYNEIHNTNFVTSDITKITAKDLNIVETDKYEYLMTYSFPCCVAETLILTRKGYKKIIDVNVGDYVLTHNNRYKKVVRKYDNGIKDVYNVNGMSFHNMKFTNNHKFYTREMYREWENDKRTYIRKFKESEWKQLKDLTKNNYLGIAINKESKLPVWNGFASKWNGKNRTEHKNNLINLFDKESFWWLIGRYIADGWYTKSGIKLAIGKKKIKDVEVVKEIFNLTINEERTAFKCTISNVELMEYVKQFGKGAENKELTNDIFDLPKELLKSFLNGYASGDGCFTQGKMKYSSVSEKLIYGLAQCVAKVYNRPFSIYKTNRPKKTVIESRIVNQRDDYQLTFKIQKDKQDKAFYENGHIWFPFKSIEYLGKENVYDIEVEEDHSFVAYNTIVHNCTDLSLAGKGEGMSRDSGTRSGLLWEVERLLDECEELPQVLLMENVTQVCGKKNIEHFKEWCDKLESLGYSNFYKNMIATEYGVDGYDPIPQTRDRTFMVSVLGDYTYEFPKKMKLQHKLKDFLEDEVDDKYYLSDKMKTYIVSSGNNHIIDKERCVVNKPKAGTITTREGQTRFDCSNYIVDTMEENTNVYDILAPKVDKLGYYHKSCHNASAILNPNGLMPTVMDNHGTINAVAVPKVLGGIGDKKSNGGTQWYNQDRIYDDNISPAIATTAHPYHLTDLRIRKLTPKECFRLMGVKDEDSNKLTCSNAQKYKQAGNSIVVNVLMAIIKEMI